MRTGRYRRKLGPLLACVGGAMFGLGPNAIAATVNVDSTNGLLTYVAGAGEANTLTMVRPPDGVFSRSVHLTDSGAVIEAGAGCSPVSAHEVVCIGVVSVDVRAGDLDDSVTVMGMLAGGHSASQFQVDALIPATMSGGDGADVLTGSDAPDALEGDAGEDTLVALGSWVWRFSDEDESGPRQVVEELEGGAGADSLLGGPGFDSLVGGPGPDSLSGGDDTDLVSYAEDLGPVVVTIDDLAGDGAPSENDNVHSDVEWVFGTPSDDTLVAGPKRGTYLAGGAGNDMLRGGPSVDLLVGGRGNDHIAGGDGGDEFYGGSGNDVLEGTPGFDYIEGGHGDDVVDGGADEDFLYGDGGSDIVNGGSGDDFVRGGPGDDRLRGGHGRDKIDGDYSHYGDGRGNDTITGGPGRDRLEGKGGNDTFYACDGERDRVDGGRGRDRGYVDRVDRVRRVEAAPLRCATAGLTGRSAPGA